jgi:polysaccharide export outer membrane protein
MSAFLPKCFPWLVCLAVLCPASAQQAGTFASRNHPYRLQPGDVVEVSYTYTPEYNSTVALEPDGMVTLKFIGSLNLADLTIENATEQIRKAASAKLHDPEVTLILKEYVKPHIVITGEVGHPGSFDLHGKATALEAIAWSGGFKESAKQKQVLLIRRTEGDMAETHLLNFKSISSAKGIREDVELQPNDILIVPKTALGAIEPYIRLSAMGLTSLYGISVLK